MDITSLKWSLSSLVSANSLGDEFNIIGKFRTILSEYFFSFALYLSSHNIGRIFKVVKIIE